MLEHVFDMSPRQLFNLTVTNRFQTLCQNYFFSHRKLGRLK